MRPLALGRLLPLALGLVVGLWTVAALAAPPKPKNAKARKYFDAAVKLYEQGDYDASADEANKGLAIEEHESLLFILAQAERQRGDCVAAVEIFSRFIEVTDSDDMRQNALTAKAICAEQLAEEARQAKLEAELQAELEAEAEPEAEPEPEPEPPPRPWYRDPLGGVLVGVGGAAVLGGGATLVAAAVLDPNRAPDYGTFDRRRQLRPQLVLAGAITAGVGSLIAAGGGLRWGLLARKQDQQERLEQARVRIGPWLSGHGTGLTLRGRF